MHHTLAITIAIIIATLVVAAPTPNTLRPRGFIQASVNWFTRWDCTNPCVEYSLCLTGEEYTGIWPQSTTEWIGWDEGCWDRPGGVHSLALSVNNGHAFTGIDISCDEYDKLVKEKKWDGYHRFGLNVAKFGEGENKGRAKGKCNVFTGEKIKAVVYDW